VTWHWKGHVKKSSNTLGIGGPNGIRTRVLALRELTGGI
jgi:hypothetical protein